MEESCGDCLRGMGACYGCGKIGYKIFECPSVAKKWREGHLQGQTAQRGKCNKVLKLIKEVVPITTSSMLYMLDKR